jgi:hypothetical protein
MTAPDTLPAVEPRLVSPPRALPSRLAAALVFLASGAVLVLEVVGLRLVAPVRRGDPADQQRGHRRRARRDRLRRVERGWLADRLPPRRLLVAGSAARGRRDRADPADRALAGEFLRGGAAAGTLLLTAAAVFAPAALLSAITPLVVKLQLSDVNHTGRVVGKLSSIGTLGAITATLTTGFVLVAALPTSVILLGLAAVLALAAVGLAIHLRRADRPAARPIRR